MSTVRKSRERRHARENIARLDESRITPGRRFPAGATPDADGANFSIWSRHATSVELLLFESVHDDEPTEIVRLDPAVHCTHFFWHVHVRGVTPGTQYSWRVDGPSDASASGLRFNPRKELVDPFARAVCDARHDRAKAKDPLASGSHLPRAVVTAPLPDHPGPAWRPKDLQGAVIYELHVGGFTQHPSSRARHPGTFEALTEKILHLKELGVTHVELLPVMAFDEQDVPAGTRARGLRNFWGYAPYAFHAPHPRFLTRPGSPRAAHEFRRMVDAFHEAGIGVLLDVVLNHTAEGGDDGAWISFRGLFNDVFYLLDPADRSRYLDFTGCGNTINCNHPLVSELLVRSLEWWAGRLRVDGFRFDLASVLTRGTDGVPMQDPPLPWQIEFSRPMADRVLIAEAWDAAGLQHAGSFPGFRWAEWNGRYRDAMRRFARGDEGAAGLAATCLAGSADLFAGSGRGPSHGVNYVACHDGFTLWDAVSHSRKHNDDNGEDGRDGRDDEPCWNGGVEGATDDPAVLGRRRRDARNMLALLLLSKGTPMLLAGDEMLRTQRGNNNAWCQDNEVSWIDWRLLESNADFAAFTRRMIALRKRHPLLLRDRFLTGRLLPRRGVPDVAWHGERLEAPPWAGGDPSVLACTLAAEDESEPDLHLVFNMSARDVAAEVPACAPRTWWRVLDTSRGDAFEPARVDAPRVPAAARSVIALESRRGG